MLDRAAGAGHVLSASLPGGARRPEERIDAASNQSGISSGTPRLTARVVAAVCATWLLIGVVDAAQASFAAVLQGNDPVPMAAALRGSLTQTLAWIPSTLAAIWLATRFPLDRVRWRRHLLVHLPAAIALAFVTNAIVVLSYWVTSGNYGSVGTLVRQGVLWMAVRLHVALLVYATIVTITQGLAYYRRARERELHLARVEGQLARARLQALNAQIRPHFLFNTMHTIGQLWRSGRADYADAVLDRLGALFHRVQETTSEAEVPLSDELDMVREYLAIEEARFPDRLRYTIDASADSLVRQVPPLILQPLVENAIRHGVSRVSTAGQVRVSAVVRDGSLVLQVDDDGPGIGNDNGTPGSSTGLRNTRERLAELYGTRGSLRVVRREPNGTRAEVVIPVDG